MAEAKKKGGNPLTKKAGPLPVWGWVAVAGGTYVVYRYIKARNAASAATAASGLTGGNLIPNDIGLPSTTSAPSGAGTFSSIGSWVQAATDFGATNGLNAGDAFNQIQAYLNGNCVSQAGYNFLSAAFANSSIGLPPAAFNSANLPSLSVCPAVQQTPTTTNPSPSPSGAVATVTQTLAHIDASTWPQIIKYGQDGNAATDFVPIGVVNNGVYTGKAAQAGAPVWAGVFGGYAQGFNESTLPNGTILYGASTLANQGYYT